MGKKIDNILSEYCPELANPIATYANKENILTNEMLEKLHAGFKNMGEHEAKAFVTTVNELGNNADPVTLIMALHQLESRKWEPNGHFLHRRATFQLMSSGDLGKLSDDERDALHDHLREVNKPKGFVAPANTVSIEFLKGHDSEILRPVAQHGGELF